MNILYIHQYFATPLGTTGTRSYEFARRWVRSGHSVQVLTTTAQLTADDLRNAKGRFFKRFLIEGIDVLAVSIPYRQQMGILKRCMVFTAFVTAAVWLVISLGKYDIIYATSTPLTVGIPALFAKWLRRKKFVFEVRDQWPQIPIKMGIIRNKILIKVLLWLEKVIYKNAAAIVALSPGMAQGIRNVLGNLCKKQIAVIPNSCDTDRFSPDIDGTALRREKNWADKFILLHTGAMGKANGLGFVVNVAGKLKNQRDILFVLVGEGNEKQTIVEMIKKDDLTNIEILQPMAKSELPKIMAAADVSIVIFANYPILEHNSANKFFDSLSAGKPVLLNYSGWQRELLEAGGAGLGCELCNMDEFIEKVLFLSRNAGILKQMGAKARQLAMIDFNRDNHATTALKLLETV